MHAFVPLAGQTALTASLILAQQLSVAARTPGELVAALSHDARRTMLVLPDLHAADPLEEVAELVQRMLELDQVRLIVECRSDAALHLGACPAAVMNLDDPQWTDRARHSAWAATQARQPATADQAQRASAPVEAVDLSDPAAVCAAAEPWSVTARYERSGDAHGGLRVAWLRAGASLMRDQAPADRALVLRAALGDDADPRLAGQLAALADGAAWHVRWSRVRGDLIPPWPGPARALAAGRGHLSGTLVVADHQDTVRLLKDANAHPVGRLPQPVAQPRAVAVRPDGTALLLDVHGHLHVQHGVSTPKPTGIAALLDSEPTLEERLLDAIGNRLKDAPATALACCDTVIAVGDAEGAVLTFFAEEGRWSPQSVSLHEGAVTALAVMDLPDAHANAAVPLLYSGGADGRVRAWRTNAEPLPTAVAARPAPVTSLAVGHTDVGLALAIGWSDGLVEHRFLETAAVRTFRPGASVSALALLSDGGLVVGTDEALFCLRAV
ncbi:hypothetical protein ACIRF8_21190 [Streptomyces sp. NPDC102406]|uniref:hypothetical protein n=1 Tax=Streptomyces sp. NPDC102406 TaxID=3366171 RepID=UPI003821A8A9